MQTRNIFVMQISKDTGKPGWYIFRGTLRGRSLAERRRLALALVMANDGFGLPGFAQIVRAWVLEGDLNPTQWAQVESAAEPLLLDK